MAGSQLPAGTFSALAMSSAVIALVIGVLFALSLAYLLRLKRYPGLPSPELREYLPLLDTRKLNFSFNQLAEKYGDLFQMFVGTTHVIVTAVPGDVAHAVGHPSQFARPSGQRFVLDSCFPDAVNSLVGTPHRKLRAHIRESFNHTLLDGFHKMMVEASEELCDSLKNVANHAPEGGWSKSIDATRLFSITTAQITNNVAFGVKLSKEKRAHTMQKVDELVDEALKEAIGHPFRQALAIFGVRKKLFECLDVLTNLCGRLVLTRLQESDKRRHSRPKDLLDSFASYYEDDVKRIVTNSIMFTMAGGHTTTQGLAWCLYETCRNPEVVEKIQAEIDERFAGRPLSQPATAEDVRHLSYISKVWKETLRFHPLLPFYVRRAEKDLTLRGSKIKIRKGQHVLALAQRAQTHPAIWQHAESFKPERWGSAFEPLDADKVPPGSYLPFGLGPANCAGKFVADHEGILILTEIHRRFRFRLSCDPQKVVSCSGWAESARSPSTPGGDLDMGVQVQVQMR